MRKNSTFYGLYYPAPYPTRGCDCVAHRTPTRFVTMVSSGNNTTLLLIDCQNDFHPGGSLAIPTADADARRIADFINAHGRNISRIVATLDTHQKLHIAHPHFWCQGKFDAAKEQTKAVKHPPPFTQISSDDILNGVWRVRPDITLPSDRSGELDLNIFQSADTLIRSEVSQVDLQSYILEYARKLEEKGRFKITIWPEHCLLGSEGHAITAPIRDALYNWSSRTGRSVEWISKGMTILTEMYSVMEAEVPVSMETSFNSVLQRSLMLSDCLIVCGQAKSHCVNYSLRDIVGHCSSKEEISRIVLFTDCSSAVPGFEDAAETFENDMIGAGVRLMKSLEFAF
jgi:nicotinamidase/pyrazinamidase